MKQFIAGFDPGGRGNFGWCLMELTDSLVVVDHGLVNCADEAFDKMKEHLDGELVAAGIDALLYWARRGGHRKSDKHVHRTSGADVMAVNSLQGACLIQGFLLAKRIKFEYPDCMITETHPKALLKISDGARKFKNDEYSEDERDAMISAWAAAQCFLHGGKPNLFCFENKKDIHAFLEETIYWWPILNSSL